MNPPTTQQPYMIPPVVQAIQSPLTSKMEKCKSTMYSLGIAEIILAGIMVLLDMIILITAHDIGQGIWCGCVLIACGIVGVVIRSQPSYCMFIINVVLSIVAAGFMAALFILSFIYGVAYWRWPGIITLQFIMVVMSFVAFIIIIVHFAHSCFGVCNLSRPTQVITPVQMSNGQVILNPNQMGQPAVYSSYVNPSMVVPTAPNPQPVSSKVVVPVVQSTESAPAQGPGYADSPPLYIYSPTK